MAKVGRPFLYEAHQTECSDLDHGSPPDVNIGRQPGLGRNRRRDSGRNPGLALMLMDCCLMLVGSCLVLAGSCLVPAGSCLVLADCCLISVGSCYFSEILPAGR